jgi:hypothetical protein
MVVDMSIATAHSWSVGATTVGWVNTIVTVALFAAVGFAAFRARTRTVWVFAAVTVPLGLLGTPLIGAVAVAAGIGLRVAGAHHRAVARVVTAVACLLAALGGIRFWIPGASMALAGLAAVPMFISAFRVLSRRTKYTVVATIAVSAALTTVVTVQALRVATSTENSLALATSLTEQGIESLRVGNVDSARRSFTSAQTRFDQVQNQLRSRWVSFATAVPVLSTNLAALRAATVTGSHVTAVAGRLAPTLPWALLSGPMPTTPGALAEVRTSTIEAAAVLDDATRSLAGVDSPWLLPALSTPIGQFRHQLEVVRGELSHLSATYWSVLPPT